MDYKSEHYRVMGIQETGEEIVVVDNVTIEAASEAADKTRKDYPEWRGVYVESMDEGLDYDPAYDDFDPAFQ